MNRHSVSLITEEMYAVGRHIPQMAPGDATSPASDSKCELCSSGHYSLSSRQPFQKPWRRSKRQGTKWWRKSPRRWPTQSQMLSPMQQKVWANWDSEHAFSTGLYLNLNKNCEMCTLSPVFIPVWVKTLNVSWVSSAGTGGPHVGPHWGSVRSPWLIRCAALSWRFLMSARSSWRIVSVCLYFLRLLPQKLYMALRHLTASRALQGRVIMWFTCSVDFPWNVLTELRADKRPTWLRG